MRFDLSALAAGESLLPSQSSATEIGICTGNGARYPLGQLEIFGRIGHCSGVHGPIESAGPR